MTVAHKKNVGHHTYISARHLVAIMCFIMCALLNMHRLVMGVAIVAMVKQRHSSGFIQTNSTNVSCPLPAEFQDIKRFNLDGKLDWSSEQQGYVLGSSFLAYIFTQLPGGRWAETWGAKRTIFTGHILAAVFTILTPIATWWHVYAVIAVQSLRGLVQGVSTPATFVVMANWFPRNERGFMSSLVISGYSFGATIGGVVTGWLCDVPQLGWPAAFYITGAFAALMSCIFAFFAHETPQSHPTISQEELKYITEGQECDLSVISPPTPWRKIFTSVPVYAFIIGVFGHYWAISYFLTVHPMYMGTILHFTMTKNGAASTIPILLKVLGGVVASFLTNWFTKKKYVDVNMLRKSFNFLGALGSSFCLLGAYWAKCDGLTNIVFFSISLFCSGISLCGSMIASGDMSPRYSGSLFGIASTVASTSTFIIPVMVGALTKNQTIEEWHTVFFIYIALVLTSGLIFNLFGSAEVQPWNDVDAQQHSKFNSEESKCCTKETSVTRF